MEQDSMHHSDDFKHLSRRERRELMRSQKGVPSGGGLLRRVLIWGGTLLVIAFLGWGMVQLSKHAPTTSSGGNLSAPVNDADHSMGPADAKVTLVEYSDFQCPACAAYSGIVTKALAEPALKGKVRFVYRYFPLSTIHPNAQLASYAAEAAAIQGKFWEMHDVLFERQQSWAPLSASAARDTFAQYAVELGLNKDTFLSDIGSDIVKKRVQTDYDSGSASGISGTPTFFVNEVRMTNPQSYDEFKQNIFAPLASSSAIPNANP